MGVGSERDWNVSLRGQLQKSAARINLPAILSQAAGVEFDRDVFCPHDIEKPDEQRSAIFFRIITEFLAQIGVADNVEQSGLCGHGQPLEVSSPDLDRIAALPLAEGV